MSKSSVTSTKNYGLFHSNTKNRPVDVSKRRDLRESMTKYGYIPAYPIHCVRENSKLTVIDGQHRLAIAQELNLPVSYMVCDDADVNIPALAKTQRVWKCCDYAGSFAAQGKAAYQELIDFAVQHNLPLSTSLSILSDQGGSINATSNTARKYKNGEFVVKNRGQADRVARLYAAMSTYAPQIKTRFFIAALWAVCCVPGLDEERLVSGARRCPENLIKYGNRDAYLTMLEHIYNFGRTKKVPLKIEAENILSKRNPVKPKTEYHRGSNGAVRVYSELEAAENRAAKLNAQEAGQ